MPQIPSSELILNPDGSIYHLNLRPEDLANTVITVGDPDRVEMVSQHFDHIELKKQKREFCTHTGTLNGQRISVISTGIGTDNIDIVLNELDALVNIDFEQRIIKEELTSLRIIRIGTSGALQEDVPVDSFLISSHAVGLDGLLHYYNMSRNADDYLLEHEFMEQVGPQLTFPVRPYFAAADQELVKSLAYDFTKGLTVTCPGFYAPQNRSIRTGLKESNLLDALSSFDYKALRATNFEMETAGIYGLANVLGHRAISCNAILANRPLGQFSQQPKVVVERLIELILGRIGE